MKTTVIPPTLRSALQRSRGSVSMEAVLIIPVFLLFLGLIAGIGRVAILRDELHILAVNTSRLASLSNSADEAERLVHRTIGEHGGVDSCRELTITVDAGVLSGPAGQPGMVTVSLTCVVDLSDLVLPGIPGSTTISETFSTAIDTYALRVGTSERSR
jgi:hypothetical protein